MPGVRMSRSTPENTNTATATSENYGQQSPAAIKMTSLGDQFADDYTPISLTEDAAVRQLEPLVGSRAVSHFLNHEYLEAEKLLALGTEDDPLDIEPLCRQLLGLCLIHRGYTADGLREISITVELAEEQAKVRALIILYFGYLYSGFEDYAHRVYMEAKMLNDDREIDVTNSPSEKHRPFDSRLDSTDCFKSRMFYQHSRACDISIATIALHKANDSAGTLAQLGNMFEVIVGLIPESIPEPFTNLRPILMDCNKFLNKCSSNDPHGKRKKNQKIVSTIKEMVILETVEGYALFMDRQYGKAFDLFNGCLDKINSSSGKPHLPFSFHTSRSIAILAAQLFVRMPQGDYHKNIMYCDHLITEILKWSEGMNLLKEHHSGRLESYFLTLGLLYFERAIFQGTIISSHVWQLPIDSLEEAIRKLIIVSTLKYNDDASIGIIYEAIVSYCLLHGGFHLKAVWFFKFLQDYFKISCTLFHVLSDLWMPPRHITLMNESVKRVVDDIEKLRWTTSEDERIAYSTFSPTVEPRRLCAPHHYFYYPPLGKLSLICSNKWLNELEASECFRKADELISLWKSAYEDHHTKLPPAITDFLIKTIGFEP